MEWVQRNILALRASASSPHGDARIQRSFEVVFLHIGQNFGGDTGDALVIQSGGGVLVILFYYRIAIAETVNVVEGGNAIIRGDATPH